MRRAVGVPASGQACGAQGRPGPVSQEGRQSRGLGSGGRSGHSPTPPFLWARPFPGRREPPPVPRRPGFRPRVGQAAGWPGGAARGSRGGGERRCLEPAQGPGRPPHTGRAPPPVTPLGHSSPRPLLPRVAAVPAGQRSPASAPLSSWTSSRPPTLAFSLGSGGCASVCGRGACGCGAALLGERGPAGTPPHQRTKVTNGKQIERGASGLGMSRREAGHRTHSRQVGRTPGRWSPSASGDSKEAKASPSQGRPPRAWGSQQAAAPSKATLPALGVLLHGHWASRNRKTPPPRPGVLGSRDGTLGHCQRGLPTRSPVCGLLGSRPGLSTVTFPQPGDALGHQGRAQAGGGPAAGC